MQPDKILAIARRYGGFYGPYEDFECLKEQLIDFAQAILDAEQESMSIDGHLRSIGTESPTTKLRWFNPFPYDRCKLQQEWVNQYGETEWRDVPTE